MINLTKEILEKNKQFISIIENEKEKDLVNSTLENQKTLKTILLDNIEKIADYTDNVDSICSETLLNLLENFKNALDLLKTNIDLLNDLLKSFDTMTQKLDNEDANIENQSINDFITSFFEINTTVTKNTLQVENTLLSSLKFSKFVFLESNDNNTVDFSPLNEKEIDEDLEISIDEDLVQTIDSSNILKNTLIISETKGKVFLPYTLSSLNDMLKNNPDKYSSIEDVIEKEYTMPFNLFKNPAIARFRESFKLIKNKEKKSIKDALDLGIELLFNYNLHPAIISACRNLDELDIYLECLENNETHKFNCFKIIFDIAPTTIINSKRS